MNPCETHFLNLFRGFVANVFRTRRKYGSAKKRHVDDGGRQPLEEFEEPPASVTGPVTAAELSEDKERLYRVLTRLPPDQRELIHLRLWQDRSWREIADRLGLASDDAARMRYARALDTLKRMLA